jgi:hypothetical protein
LWVLVPADRFPQELGSAGEIQFLFDPRTVGLDRLHADPERFGYLARGASLAEPLEDLQFAVAELLDRRTGCERFALNKLGGHRRSYGFADAKFAFQDLANGRDHLPGRLALHEVTPGARPQCAFRVMRFFVHGEDQHRYRRTALFQVFDQLNARGILQRDVHDGDIGLQRKDSLPGLRPALGFSADPEARLLID